MIRGATIARPRVYWEPLGARRAGAFGGRLEVAFDLRPPQRHKPWALMLDGAKISHHATMSAGKHWGGRIAARIMEGTYATG